MMSKKFIPTRNSLIKSKAAAAAQGRELPPPPQYWRPDTITARKKNLEK
jgi:hypothetical protein